MTLRFTEVTSIEAGKAYLVKWTSGENVANPEFDDVTISSTASAPTTSSDGKVTFAGTYSPTALTANTTANLYLSNNNWYYPSSVINVNTFRAYLQITLPAGSRVMDISFDPDDETTGITDVRSETEVGRGEVYNLNGQRVKTPRKGLYIVNGKKVIMK